MDHGDSVCRAPNLARRRLGALPDAHGLYPRLSAKGNIAYFGRLHGMSEDAIHAQIRSLIERWTWQPLLIDVSQAFHKVNA